MLFPESPRVVYAKPPVYEVTSQFRFPPILRIHAETPVRYQEAVRHVFPYYTLETTAQAKKPATQQDQQVVTFNLGTSLPKLHRFASADKAWSITLKNDELALFCRRYSRWEMFQDLATLSFQNLDKEYKPSFYSHVCVKFKNAILRSGLGLKGVNWAELLNPVVMGPFADQKFEPLVRSNEIKFTISLPDASGSIDATIGLGQSQKVDEQAMLIECHVYQNSQIQGVNNVIGSLGHYHKVARSFFRWCISERLHDAMGPRPVDSGPL